MTARPPALSVVVALGRSGNEPRDFEQRLVRMLSSLDHAAATLSHGAIEAVVVDWNAPQGALPLRETVAPPVNLAVRVISVPAHVHEQAAQDSGRQFLEGPAKNVGAVRARAERLLVTNPDVIIRADLLEFCVKVPLDAAFVRADRYDFRRTDSLDALAATERVFVAHVRHGPNPGEEIHLPVTPGSAACTWPRSRPLEGERGEAEIWGPPGGVPAHFLRGAHTNGAGDFLGVTKDAFRAAGGWNEDPTIYHHGDALFVAQLLGAGLSQVIYAHPGALLHEDHPRVSEEARGGGAASWPSFLARIQDVLDRREPRDHPPTFGFEHDDLTEHAIL